MFGVYLGRLMLLTAFNIYNESGVNTRYYFLYFLFFFFFLNLQYLWAKTSRLHYRDHFQGLSGKCISAGFKRRREIVLRTTVKSVNTRF